MMLAGGCDCLQWLTYGAADVCAALVQKSHAKYLDFDIDKLTQE